jgi:propionate CoA-transferase
VVENGALRVIQEGRNSKFLPAVEQITFNGEIAARKGQTVFYVTERAVFQLTAHGLELIEIAPGIDIDAQILALIPFPVAVHKPRLMDARIYGATTMGLAKILGAELVDGCVIAPEDELERRRNARKRGRLSEHDDPDAVAAAAE